MNRPRGIALALVAGILIVAAIALAWRRAATSEPTIESLAADVRSDDAARRQQAIARLARRPDGASSLLSLVEDETAPAEARAVAIAALTPAAARDAVATLARLVADERAPAPVRAASARALGGLRYAAAADAIAGLLGDENTCDAAEAALMALGEASLPRAAATYADGGAPAYARTAAAHVLATLGDAAVAPLARAVDKSAEAYQDNGSFDTTLVREGVLALGRIGTPSAVEALVKLVDQDHPFAFDDALAALAMDKSADRLEILLGFLEQCGDPAHCDPLGEALSGYGSAVRPRLVHELRSADDYGGGRIAAAVALGRMGSDEDVEALASVLTAEAGNDSHDTYDAIAAALAESGSPRAASLVRERVDRPDFRFIAGAYYPLKDKIDPKLIVEAMHRYGDFFMASFLINDPNPVLRDAARKWALAHGYEVTSQEPGGTITP